MSLWWWWCGSRRWRNDNRRIRMSKMDDNITTDYSLPHICVRKQVTNAKDVSKVYLEASTNLAKDVGKMYYDGELTGGSRKRGSERRRTSFNSCTKRLPKKGISRLVTACLLSPSSSSSLHSSSFYS